MVSTSRWLSWFLIVPAMTLPCISAIFYFDLYSGHPLATALYFLTKFFTLFWPLVATFLIFRYWIPRFELRHSRHTEALVPGAITGSLIAAVMILGLFTPIGDAVFRYGWRIRQKAQELGFYNLYIPFAIFLSFFTPYWKNTTGVGSSTVRFGNSSTQFSPTSSQRSLLLRITSWS